MTINPSKPMFMTPARSENTPPSEVNISGAARAIIDGIIICNTW